MKRLLFILIVSISIFNFTIANILEDKAFYEYKNHNFKKAFELYKEAAKDNSLKALFMVGLFLEKGVGVDKNIKKAIKIYNIVLKRTQNIKEIIKSGKKDDLKITISALKRLYLLTGNQKYLEIEKRIENLLYKNSTDDNNISSFLTECPMANSVPIQYREGIEDINCELFIHFNKRMVAFMKLKYLKIKALKEPIKNHKLLSVLDTKIKNVIKPIIKYIKNKTINCYKEAQTNIDIEACKYDYLHFSDPLLFDNAALRMEQQVANRLVKSHNLSSKEKAKLVKNLIKYQSFGEPFRNGRKIKIVMDY